MDATLPLIAGNEPCPQLQTSENLAAVEIKSPGDYDDHPWGPRMIVITSFDFNKPGEEVKDLKEGVTGVSIMQGVLRVGDAIEVSPGINFCDNNSKMACIFLLCPQSVQCMQSKLNCSIQLRVVLLAWAPKSTPL